ncbi:PEGA domain-containing protein, partial [Candidatus Peregrinibacteria bacterium]|nr:PEGA domain-containing protein [Candidatus Peregrinibacteria bacterium]
MTNKTKSIVAFAICMALAAGIYLWTGPLNRGTVSITGETANALVSTIEGTTQCVADPCLVSMTSGMHELTVQKDGFFPEKVKVAVKRFKTESVQVAVKKIPNL